MQQKWITATEIGNTTTNIVVQRTYAPNYRPEMNKDLHFGSLRSQAQELTQRVGHWKKRIISL